MGPRLREGRWLWFVAAPEVLSEFFCAFCTDSGGLIIHLLPRRREPNLDLIMFR